MDLANVILTASQAHTMSEPTRDMLSIGSEHPRRDGNYVMAKAKEIIRDYDMYSFTKSAVYAASDLRFEISNDTFFAICEVIFSEKRKIYIECSYDERVRAFSHIHKFSREHERLVSDPDTVAITLESNGDGTGKIGACWKHAKIISPLHIELAKTKPYSVDKNKINALGNVTFSLYECFVDMNNVKGKSETIEEFIENKEEAGSFESTIYLNTLLNPELSPEDKSVYENAYIQYKLGRIAMIKVPVSEASEYEDRTKRKGFADESLQKDIHGEFTFAIPFVGLLLSGVLDKKEHKQRVFSKKSSTKAKKDDLEYKAGLTECSLNLSRELKEAQASREHEMIEHNIETNNGEKRKSPTLHFVRGHTFVRNGRISYRKPHFRGSASDEKVITRVTA